MEATLAQLRTKLARKSIAARRNLGKVVLGIGTGAIALLSKTDTTNDASARRGTLRIIATTDLHGALLPHDYFTDTPRPGTGLIGLSRQIAALRNTTATTILLDNGDFLQGTPMTDAVVVDENWQNTHPMVETMNVLGYDAVTLGNHEFNFGLGMLSAAIRDFSASVVCANIFQRDTGGHFVESFVVLKRNITLNDDTTETINIGVLGLAPPQITTWDARVVGDEIQTIDILQAAADQIPRLKQAGADIVVVLAHTGIGPDHAIDMQENVAVPLAALDGIDALVLGHTHEIFPTKANSKSPFVNGPSGTIHEKPAIMPAAMGLGIGHIDLLLERRDNGWEIFQSVSKLRCADEPCDQSVIETPPLAIRAHQETLALIQTPIGETQSTLQSYFSMVSNCPIVQLINDAQRALIAADLAGTQMADLPLLSVASPFKSGGHGGASNYIDIPTGPLAICNAAEIYPFPNTICAAFLTGAEIRTWLERAASVFLTIDADGGEQPLLNADFPSYDFDVFDGLSYEINLTGPPMFCPDGRIANPSAQRITKVSYNGAAMAPEDRFVVATNNYRIGGGGGFFKPDPTRVIVDTKKAARDVLVDHIKATGVLDQTAIATWSFAQISGAVGLFETGHAAPAFVDSIMGRRILGFSQTPDGRTIGCLALG